MKNIILVFIVICVLTVPAYGEYYRYEDSNGNVVFTDNPSNIPENRKSGVKIIKEPQSRQKSEAESKIHYREELKERWKEQDEEMDKYLREYMKKGYGAKDSCPAETKSQTEQTIKTTWSQMVQAMTSGDLDKASGFFSVFSRDEMKRKLSGMGKEDLKNIFKGFKSIEIETLNEQDGIAECGVLRSEESGTFSYPASFVRDSDCVWRIRGF